MSNTTWRSVVSVSHASAGNGKPSMFPIRKRGTLDDDSLHHAFTDFLRKRGLERGEKGSNLRFPRRRRGSQGQSSVLGEFLDSAVPGNSRTDDFIPPGDDGGDFKPLRPPSIAHETSKKLSDRTGIASGGTRTGTHIPPPGTRSPHLVANRFFSGLTVPIVRPVIRL